MNTRKFFWFFFSLSMIITATFVTSCFIADDDENEKNVKVSKPSILSITENNANTILIHSPVVKNAKYANVFRQSCSNDKFEEEVSTVNIGQVNPADGKSFSTIEFYDSFTSAQKFYRYYIRWYDGEKYITSTVSNVAAGLGTSEADITGTAEFIYSRNDKASQYYLVISDPDDDLRPVTEDFSKAAVLIKTDDETEIFEMNSGELNLSIIGEKYLDKQLTVEGLIGISTSTRENVIYYYYTNPFAAAVTYVWIDSAGEDKSAELTELLVPSVTSSSSGLDY